MVHNFYQKPGGEDTVFNNEKRLLEEHGHHVFTYTRNNNEIREFNLFQKLVLPLTTIFNIKTYYDIKRIVKENSIDIIHVHNTLCLISPSIFYVAIKMKVPVIQTLHNFRMQCANGLFYRDDSICEDCINDGIICALKHKCYRNSYIQTLIVVIMMTIHRLIGIFKKINYICLTKFNKQKLLLINKNIRVIDKNRVYVKPNFVFNDKKYSFKDSFRDYYKTEVFEGASDSVNNDNSYFYRSFNNVVNLELSKSSCTNILDREYYLFIGRLDKIKGIDIVLGAFAKMPNRVLHVIGSGGMEYINEFSKYSNIKFLGHLAHDDVMKEMLGGRALVFASKCYETFGMTIIEAYCNDLPVISNDIGNSRFIVRDKITGICFSANSIDSLIAAIGKLDNADVKSLKTNARQEYEKKYSDKVAYNNLLGIYERILLTK